VDKHLITIDNQKMQVFWFIYL